MVWQLFVKRTDGKSYVLTFTKPREVSRLSDVINEGLQSMFTGTCCRQVTPHRKELYTLVSGGFCKHLTSLKCYNVPYLLLLATTACAIGTRWMTYSITGAI